MLAHHPITGKEIRVIQTDASIWKEFKTLVVSPNRQVYDTVCSTGSPDYKIQLEAAPPKALVDFAASSKLFFVCKQSLGRLTVDEFKKLKIQNVMALEEMHNMFPHLGANWDGTAEDAAIMIAGLLRYRRIQGAWNKRAEAIGLIQSQEPPPRLWWLTQYYTPSTKKRQQEIQKCLEVNSQSKLIDRIILLNEKPEQLPTNTRVPIEEHVINKRLTYADVIEKAKSFPNDVILAFANADICIDDNTWRQLWDVNMDKKFLALLRYDVPESGDIRKAELFGPRADSQDTWIVRVADLAQVNTKVLDFNFGRMGCDNAIALEMLKQKFLVVNPAFSLKTWHYHISGVRNYDKNDVLDKPVFHYIHPSGFHDLNPVFAIPKDEVSHTVKPATLLRPVRGGGATTWIMAANKDTEAILKMENTNPFTPSEEQCIEVKNCFQTPTGLVFDKDRLLIGKSARAQKLWSSTQMSTMTPSLECERGLIAPWPEGAEKSRELYVLKYLSKILQLVPMDSAATAAAATICAVKGWEFFCPEDKHIVEALESFQWRTGKLPVIKYEEDIVIWCKEARAFVASENTCILAEDIEALRKSVRGWLPNIESAPSRPRLVIVEDGKVLTEEFVNEIEEVLKKAFEVKVVYPKTTSSYRLVNVLCGAWGVVCAPGMESCGWNWLLPKNAYVFEVIESSANANANAIKSGLEISAASSLEHRFCLNNKDKIFDEIWKEEESWKLSAAATTADTNLPTIWIPRRDMEGYFAHPGDSFREMARLWAKSGLCRLREHALATMVWWGEVGAKGVLLYDRPNHDWRLAAPLIEKDWKFALFGNPKPPTGSASNLPKPTSSPWFFWPRRPEFVEELAAAGAPNTSWAARNSGAVFYGKTENKVQEKRRTTADWQTACSEWVMVKGADEQYPFTQRQYLEKLSQARFGLCLAGYGFKCHREVECMSMGCVPLCSPEVDMDSYASPPIEGVHYIRVTSPEEARIVAESMSEEKWTLMSEACKKWWHDTASCAGSFALTKRLIESNS